MWLGDINTRLIVWSKKHLANEGILWHCEFYLTLIEMIFILGDTLWLNFTALCIHCLKIWTKKVYLHILAYKCTFFIISKLKENITYMEQETTVYTLPFHFHQLLTFAQFAYHIISIISPLFIYIYGWIHICTCVYINMHNTCTYCLFIHKCIHTNIGDVLGLLTFVRHIIHIYPQIFCWCSKIRNITFLHNCNCIIVKYRKFNISHYYLSHS